ncbi:unnamed protein product [Lasius platythorax]|uniref:Uncharacterized protein n=1 Tax=Lasius platythorax TaxID=488582 RepID=A0AAV2MXA6_9HYME
MERPTGQIGERGEPGVEQGNEDSKVQNCTKADRTEGGRNAEDDGISRADLKLRGLGGEIERRRRAADTTETVSREEGESREALGAAS